MSKHTSFKIGGPADALVVPESTRELASLVDYCSKNQIPYFVMGNGTNLLVRDKGIRGVVIKISGPLGQIHVQQSQIRVGAGADLRSLSQQAAKHNLTGLEFAVGIPGSVGGAIVMNAGAYNGEMQNIVTQVQVLTPEGVVQTLPTQDLAFGYRQSIFQQNHAVILEATLALKPGDSKEINAQMQEFTERREQRQPLNFPSAGSVFRRPPKHYVGPMLEELGLKGFSVNDAQVSSLHAGFIVNRGQATAQDVLDLIQHIQDLVWSKFQVELTPEIKIIGEV